MLLRKNSSLGELGNQGFLALLMVEQACYMFATVGKDAFGEDYVPKFYGGTYSGMWQGKPRRQIKSVYI